MCQLGTPEGKSGIHVIIRNVQIEHYYTYDINVMIMLHACLCTVIFTDIR